MTSLAGTWMQSTAQGYLVYQLTASPVYLGLVGFASGLPTLLFTLFGGIVADRLPRRTLLVITQFSMLVLAFILAGLTFANLVHAWHIVILAFLLGIANAFDAPARISFVTELVSREDMTNAIALNSTMFNIATIVGPSLAGLTYAALGPAWCFTLNGISFVAVIIALLLMHIAPFVPPPCRDSKLHDLTVGLRYVLTDRLSLALTGSAGMVGILALGMMNLLPAWATDVLHGDVKTNGWLIAARGVGSLFGGLMLAAFGKRKIRGILWTIGSFTMPLLLLFFSIVHWLPFSLIMLVGLGWSTMLIIINNNAIIQSRVEDNLRGRVMSVYTLVFFSAMPIGSLLAGVAAEKIGEPLTVAVSAIILGCFAITARIFLPVVRKQE